jgi:eukaryotic-like serine/threonine-protein kinase
MPEPLRIGRYALHDEIASGGMASVHFGRLLGAGGFSKTVAIKRLHRRFARAPSFQTMILEEGRLAARIRHPNVVPPLDVLAEGGELLLVMEYVHGESLSRLIKAARAAGERVPVAVGAAILSNVLHGLHAAHEAKDESGKPLDIVHRDVSPQNVIVGVDGVARVIDFGIAKAVTSDENTTAGTIKGKIPYLAPEQLEGEPATRRTDVYAAGIVLWETLVGRRLFDGGDDSEVLRQILTMAVPPPSRENRQVPPPVDAVVLRALSKRPRERFGSAREMALAIEDAVHLATATTVGAWAERLAGVALTERAEKLAEIEATSSASGPLAAADPPTAPRGPRASLPPSPGLEGGPVPLDAIAPPTVAFRARPPGRGIPEPVATSTPLAAPGAPPPAPKPPPAGALRKPALEIANVAWMPTPPVAEVPKRRVGPWLAFLLVALLLGAWLAIPWVIQRAYVAAAARHGVVLSIDRVEASRRSFRAVGVRAESLELPGVVVHARSAVITGFAWSPEAATVDDLEVTLDGTYPDVASRIDDFRAARGGALDDALRTVRRVEITSGRLEWAGALGPDTIVRAENVSVEAKSSGARSVWNDLEARSPLVTVRTRLASAGPWLVHVKRSEGGTTGTVRFDPVYPSTATLSKTDEGTVTLGLAIPPSTLESLHLPPAILGGVATSRSRLEARGELSISPPSPDAAHRAARGRVIVAAGGLAVFAGGQSVDVSIDVAPSGEPAEIELEAATLTFGASDAAGGRAVTAASGPLAGKLSFARTAQIDLAGRTTPLACTGGGQTALAATITVALDRLAEAKVSFVPTSACAPRFPR